MPSERHEIDWVTFIIALGIVLMVAALLVIFPAAGSQAIDSLFSFLTKRLGWLYIACALGGLLILLGLALSPFRKIRFGDADQAPHYSTFSWAGMLFSTGIGTALLYWGTIEWIEYYLAPPLGLEPKSPEALQWSMSYGMFHWGILGWVFYAVPTVCLCYSYHVAKRPSPSIAESCAPLLRGYVHRWPGRLINALFMIGLVGTASTGLGLTTPLITEAFGSLFGIESSFGLTLAAIALVVFLIAMSVSLGLDQGIKRLSNVNLVLMFLLLGLIFLFGAPGPIARQGVDSVGFMLSNFPQMSGIFYPGTNKEFVESWTVFYWAWWLAFGPFVGMFICKISGGRTLGQVIWGVLGFGTLGCTLCFVVFGGYASYLEHEMGTELVSTFSENKHSVIIQMLITLPMGKWILPLFLLLCVTFAATTYDSAAYTLAASATRRLPVDRDPACWHRVVWAIALGVLPLTLLSLNHQTKVLVALQTASIVVSIPMMIVVLMMLISLGLEFKNRR